MNKKSKSKVNTKILNKKGSEISGIDIANIAAEKRRKVETKAKPSKVKKIKIKKTKEKVVKTKKTKPISFNKYKVKINISKIILVIITIFIVVALVIFINNKHILGITLKTNVDKKDSILIELATGNNEIFAYKNEILVYSNGSMKTYNKYGKKTWEYKFEELFSPSVKTNGKYLQVTNKDNGYIYIFENRYEVARIKIDGDIEESNININGDTSVLYSSLGTKATIGIYSKSGKELTKIKPNNANISNFKLSDNRKNLVYTEVVMQGVSISENVNLVTINKDNTIKTIKSIASEMIYNLDIKGNNIDMVTDSTIYRYNLKTGASTEEKLDNKNIMYLDYEDKNLSVISRNINSDAKSQLIIKNIVSKKEKIADISDVPKDFQYTNNLSYIISQKQIEVYNNFGKKIKGYTSDNIIVKVEIFNDGKSIAVPYSNKIEIINI